MSRQPLMKIPVAEYENLKSTIESLQQQLKEGDINKDIHFDCYNERAFWHNFEQCYSTFPCVLITFNVNVEKVNQKYGREVGTKVISDIVAQLKAKGVDVYHIQGEKFNIFYKQWEAEKLQNLWDLTLDEDYEVSIYIGEIKSIDCKGVSAQELKDIAVNMMYRDKKIKRPKNKNLLRIEAENKRLEMLIKDNERLISEKEGIIEKTTDAKRKAVIAQNDNDLTAIARIAEMEKKRKEEQAEIRYLRRCEEQGIIPHTQIFVDEGLERTLRSMYFSKSEYRYEVDGKAYKTVFYVFPISFAGIDKSLDIVVGIENNGKIEIAKGNFLEYGFNTIKVTISARIDKGGILITNIQFPQKATVMSHSSEVHDREYTPDVFGKRCGDMQIFPMRTGLSGYCESIVLLADGNIVYSEGVVSNEGKRYFINLTEDKVYLEEREI